jgi:hypothetical protein
VNNENETPVDNNDEMPADNGNGTSGDSKKIILIVGAVTVIVAIILLIAFLPKEPEVDPYVVQLEQEKVAYTAQVDSLVAVVDGLNGRLDNIRAQMDSARAANRTLIASLHRVANQMKEFQRLYQEQQALSKKLVTELKQVKQEKERATTQARMMKIEVDSLNGELYEKTIRLVRLESSLEEAVQQAKAMKETATSVLVYVGTEEELKQAGYLKTGRSFFRKSFRAIGFPDVLDEQNRNAILRVSLGQTLPLQGELDALTDRHGKLGKGDEYEISKGPPGQTLITFIDPTLQGQRILAVLKKKK